MYDPNSVKNFKLISKEHTGLPLMEAVEFMIDIVYGAEPVCKTPYWMGTFKSAKVKDEWMNCLGWF